MIDVRNMIFLILLDIKRVFRDIKYVFFIIALPILFYIVYTAIFPNNANVTGVPWSEYCLISMISFGIMGNAINLLGTKVADERSKKWYTYIRVSPVNYFYYGLSHIFSYLTISLFFTFLMFVLAFFYKDINLGLVLSLKIGLVLNLASVVFLMLALIIGRLGSLSQPIGTILYLMLSFLGGLWMPVAAMPKFLSHLAVLLPSYNYAKLGWCLLAHKRLAFNSVVNLLAYFVIFTLLYVYLQKREQMN